MSSVPEKPELLDAPLDRIVGSRSAKKLASLDLQTGRDLLLFFPRRYAHWGKLTPLVSVSEGEDVTLLAQVVSADMIKNRNRGVRLSVELTDGVGTINATFFARHPGALSVHQRLLKPGSQHLFAGKISSYRGRVQLTHPDFEQFEGADAQSRVERPIPIYPATRKCPSWLVGRSAQIVAGMVRESEINDPLDDEVKAANGLISLIDAIKELHDPRSDHAIATAKKTVRWAEALVLQAGLLQKRAKHMGDAAHPIDSGDLLKEAKENLPFKLTGGQEKALSEILEDMSKAHPMQRLLQADVGAGKTVVAGLAMTAAVEAGYQAALLAPTEVLAQQHAISLSKMFSVPVELLTGSSKTAKRKVVSQLAATAQPAIFVGTHALIQDSLQFSSLALVVVDEQHRFGVAQREKLREDREVVPHMLTMTATPIPRTIAMTVFGDLDVTAIHELPKGRVPVQTFLVNASNPVWVNRMWERAREEIDAGGRVFVVAPRIDSTEGEDSELASVEDTYQMLAQLPALNGVPSAILHGRMNPEEKAQIIGAFNSGEVPLLVTTTVIEVGVDIQAASMMVILDSQQFGLSQLHQLRGRVGRGGQQAICMAVHKDGLLADSMKRLEAFAATTDGFKLAEADLGLRREGNVLGGAQSGGRTSLKALRVMRDSSIIEGAREHAAKLVDEDPSLSRHPRLLAAIALLDEETTWMERS